MRSTLLALATTAILTPFAARSQDPAALIARIEAAQTSDTTTPGGLTVAQLLRRYNTPGVSIAVIKDFKIHWAKGYGLADAESGKPVDTNTAFQAASISKPITAMAAVKLSQDGKLSLDGDVNAILTSWKVPASEHTSAQPVTARSLFSHLSGSDDGFGFPGYDPNTPMPTPVQVITGEKPSNTGKVTFGRPPYQAAKYSGGGLTILQVALTDLARRPFADFMQSTILGPLGMSGSSYVQPPPAAAEPRLARAHGMDGKRRAAPWHIYPEQAAAGLWTTPSDLARVIIEVQQAVRGNGKILTPAGAREMLTPVGNGPFAVGFSIDKRGEGWYFGHGGANWGFRADIVGHFRKGYGVAIMTNADQGGLVIRELEARVAAAYQWDSLDKPLPR